MKEKDKKEEYAATYTGGKYGKSVVHIVAPPPMSEEEKERIIDEMHKVGWEIVYSLRMKGVKI